MDNKSAEEIRLKNMRYDMVMEDDLMQRHAYHNNSNTSQVNSKKDKTRQWHIHRLVAYNDNDNDNDSDNHNDYHYSMNSDGMKIIS